MFKRTHMAAWLFTGILLWPLLALIADESFGQKGSDAVAYAGIAIVIYLYVDAFRVVLMRSRYQGMRFTYRTYRKAEQIACDETHRLFGLYSPDYRTNRKYVEPYRASTKLYTQIRSRRKREHQKWPMQRYIANTAVVKSMGSFMTRGRTVVKDAAIPKTPCSPTVTMPKL